MGRPHRLRLPRLRGRGAGRDRRARRCSRPRCASAAASGAAARSARSSRGRRCRGAVGRGRDGRRWREALAEFRAFNFERIYLRPGVGRAGPGRGPGAAGAGRALRRPAQHAAVPRARRQRAPGDGSSAGAAQALREAVTYVAGMTDRFAFGPGGRAPRLGPGRAARRSRRRDRSVNDRSTPHVARRAAMMARWESSTRTSRGSGTPPTSSRSSASTSR